MADLIRQWFTDHDDGQFTIPSTGSPYSVVPAASDSRCVVYCTKPELIHGRIDQGAFDVPFTVIGRYGLPNDYDVAWMQSLVTSRRFVFLGDADPPGLLIFAWLRSRLDISFAGINDSLLDQSNVPLNERVTMPQASAEIAASPLLLDELPDTVTLLGSRCAAMLESGQKCELEGLFNYSTQDAERIFRAIDA